MVWYDYFETGVNSTLLVPIGVLAIFVAVLCDVKLVKETSKIKYLDTNAKVKWQFYTRVRFKLSTITVSYHHKPVHRSLVHMHILQRLPLHCMCRDSHSLCCHTHWLKT